MSDLRPPSIGEERVSTVVGGRLCAACGFSLVGQSIVREPHYRLLIVRCPECGTVAALQEYPALGRWAHRWAALLAALWLVALIAALFASAGIVFGVSHGIAESSSQDFAMAIATAHNDWYNGLENQNASAVSRWAGPGGQPAHAYTFIDLQWWSQQDPGAHLAAQGGWWKALRRGALWGLWFLLPIGVAIGTFWSIALLGVRRFSALLVSVVILGMAASFLFLSLRSASAGIFAGVAYANHLALGTLGFFAGGLPLAVAGACIVGGIWFGRPLVRLLVRTLLPPSLRGPLALLWTADGLPPPGTR